MALTRIRRTGLNDGLVSDSKLDSGVGTQAVTTSTIRNGAITTLKLADNSITVQKLSSTGGLEAVGTTVIQDGAVTPPKIDGTSTFNFNAASVATTLSVTGKAMRSAGLGQGLRCKKCGNSVDKSWLVKAISFETPFDGWVEPTPANRRHLAKPLQRGLPTTKNNQG